MSVVILHVAETLKGGIASYLDEVLPFQVATFGHDNVALLIPEDQAGEIKHGLGVKVVTFPPSGSRFRHVLQMMRSLQENLPTLQPALLHAHSSFAGAATRLFARRRGFPARVIYCAHGWAFDRDAGRLSKAFYRWLESRLAHWCSSIVCISRHDYDSARAANLPAEKLVLIPNAIGPLTTSTKTPDWPAGCKRFLFVGRLDRQKGADIFIESMRRIRAPAFAYLAGAPVVSNADDMVLPDNVVATGWLDRNLIQAYIASADVVVIPSRWEGFGLVTLEAMRAGKPVIASRTGGLVELVEDGVTGKLIQPGCVNSLVEAMEQACHEDWSEKGKAGRQRFLMTYTSDRLNNSLLETYKHVLARTGHLALC